MEQDPPGSIFSVDAATSSDLAYLKHRAWGGAGDCRLTSTKVENGRSRSCEGSQSVKPCSSLDVSPSETSRLGKSMFDGFVWFQIRREHIVSLKAVSGEVETTCP